MLLTLYTLLTFKHNYTPSLRFVCALCTPSKRFLCVCVHYVLYIQYLHSSFQCFVFCYNFANMSSVDLDIFIFVHVVVIDVMFHIRCLRIRVMLMLLQLQTLREIEWAQQLADVLGGWRLWGCGCGIVFAGRTRFRIN